ncbi:MAG: YARHG domain-containing protein [Clostridiales bacterium]|nr:YARHG domain-containing protein [Clostridiales bacterium]
MNCPYCHRETEDTAAFCTKCGKRIPRCPTCGEVITARIRFCTKDGTPIPEELTRDLPGLDDTVVVPPVAPTETRREPHYWTEKETDGQPTLREEPLTQSWKETEEPYQQPPTEEEPPKKSGGTVIAVILAIIVVAVIAVVVILWTKGMLGQSDLETDEENQTSIVEEESEAQDDENEEQTEDEEQAENGAEETDNESEAEREDETGTEEESSEGETADETEETEQTQQIDVSLTTDELTVYEGMTYQIIGDNADQVSWTYSVVGVVEVDSSGQLTAKAAGTTVATATGPNGETDSVEVTVLALETDDQETDDADETEETENNDDTGVTATSDDYVLPNSSSRYLSESDLTGLNAWQCRVARNEIYARHGRLFDDDTLQEYFDSKSWYYGYIDPDDFALDLLNDYEIKNLELIVAYEKEMNYNQAN